MMSAEFIGNPIGRERFPASLWTRVLAVLDA